MSTNSTDQQLQWPTNFRAGSVAGNIYEAIKDAIIAGKWFPGDRLNDQLIAQELQASRISVREALSKLVETDLVEKVRWKGYFLRCISLEEAHAIIEVRGALEELAVKNVMKSPPDGLFDELEEAIDKAEEFADSGLSGAEDHKTYMRAVFRFHNLIYEASGNFLIERMISNLRLQIEILRNVAMVDESHSTAHRSLDEHREILSHMKARDEEGALQAVQKHMQTHYHDIARGFSHHTPKSKT